VSEVAEPPAGGCAPPRSFAAAAGEHRWRRPPSWLWAASIGLQVLAAAVLTSFTFFLVDDYEFLTQARLQSFNLGYLREGLYEHFSPVSRVLDKLLVVLAPGSFVLAHTVELALYACALLAFALLMRAILGNGWRSFAFTIVFGQSIFLIRLLYWWTATANILPSSVGMLLALGCYLRWRETGSWLLLFGSFAAYALALLDYETSILFPLYPAVISLLVLERHPGPRRWLAVVWRERWAWIGYVALDAAAVVNYYRYYYKPATHPSFSELAHYLAIALFQTFVPALVGVRYTPGPGVAVAAGFVVLAAVAVTLYLRPRAWRCLAAFILVFLINMLPVGINKITQTGVAIGEAVYYQQSAQFMFLVLAAFAISSRWSGRRAWPQGEMLRPTARRWPAFAIRRPSPRALTAAGTAAVAVYATLYITSVRALAHQVWQEGKDSAYVQQYLASDKQVRAATGREPVLVDLDIPTVEVPRRFFKVPMYGVFLALFNPNLRVGELVKQPYVLGPSGRLLPVRFIASTRGLLGQASVTTANRSAEPAADPSGGSNACVPAGLPASWLRVPLARPQQLHAQPQGFSYLLRVRFRMAAAAHVRITLVAWRGGPGFAGVSQEWGRGAGGRLIALSFTGQLRELDFRLPAGACVTQLNFGHLRYTHNA
jgi:hypothetical protein